MPRFDQDSAECLILTYRSGLLSPIAHDLKIRAERLFIEVDEEPRAVRAEVDASSLRVVTAMKEGRENPSALSDKDKREIERNIREDVLHAGRHPTIRFESTKIEKVGTEWIVEGDLTLHGTTRRIETRTSTEGDSVVVELVLHQPDFGVKPYTAALGTLKVQADVKVRVSVPLADV